MIHATGPDDSRRRRRRSRHVQELLFRTVRVGVRGRRPGLHGLHERTAPRETGRRTGSERGAERGQPDAWSVYLATDDAADTTRRVTAAGGVALAEPMPIGDFGTMALSTDPAGSVFRVWQSGTHTGFEVDAERDPGSDRGGYRPAGPPGVVRELHPRLGGCLRLPPGRLRRIVDVGRQYRLAGPR